jgi:hypothetical protein
MADVFHFEDGTGNLVHHFPSASKLLAFFDGGVARIEWTCPYGVLLYGDYVTEAIASTQTLEASLQAYTVCPAGDGATPSELAYSRGQMQEFLTSGSANAHSMDITNKCTGNTHSDESLSTTARSRDAVSTN